MPDIQPGKVHLVGAGPGDPELATARARACLATADVVVYDHLANPVLLDCARDDAERVFVGKESGRHTLPQAEIEALLIEHARAGKSVVRLKGGDPFIYGRGGEEMAALIDAGIPFEIVPGVTAALAAAAYCGIPLTHREHSSAITFLTGHENPEKHTLSVDFAAHARTGATLCIYMGVGQLPRIVGELRKGGLGSETPVAVIQWATLPAQRSLVSTLDAVVGAVEQEGLAAPAIIIVGEVVGFPRRQSWFEDRPLHGRRIVVTRASGQSGALAGRLTDAGAEVVELPFIRIEQDCDRQTVAEVISDIARFEWVVFTSANGVRAFFKILLRAFSDIRCLGPARIAAVGQATARELRKFNIAVDVQPERADADHLGKAMIEAETLENVRVLVITGNRNRADLVAHLEAVGGAIVDTLPLYRTELEDWADLPSGERFLAEGADAILFTSSSTVDSYVRQMENNTFADAARRPAFGSIGQQTSESLEKAKLPLAFEAKNANLEAFVEACSAHFSSSRSSS